MVSSYLNALTFQLNYHLSILGRQPAIYDGELGMNRATDSVIYSWDHLGHYVAHIREFWQSFVATLSTYRGECPLWPSINICALDCLNRCDDPSIDI